LIEKNGSQRLGIPNGKEISEHVLEKKTHPKLEQGVRHHDMATIKNVSHKGGLAHKEIHRHPRWTVVATLLNQISESIIGRAPHQGGVAHKGIHFFAGTKSTKKSLIQINRIIGSTERKREQIITSIKRET
jgi:hypothetical protein